MRPPALAGAVGELVLGLFPDNRQLTTDNRLGAFFALRAKNRALRFKSSPPLRFGCGLSAAIACAEQPCLVNSEQWASDSG
jgi:hypothetical protein